MKVRLDENIRAMRKARRLTQEQLAVSMNVTVGAVSKWESGQSTPDISIIVELADFFETSVDVLLGYEWRDGSMGKTAERIKALMLDKNFDEGLREADKALQKYPNCFEIVYASASLFSMKGLEGQNKRELQRAQELYRRACELIDQNTALNVSAISLENDIARIYLMLGETENALTLLKKNNTEYVNSGAIGCALASISHKPDEALNYLSESLWTSVMQIFRTVIGYANAYTDKRNYSDALDILKWMRTILDGLKTPGQVTYLDRCDAMLFSGAAGMAAMNGDMTTARDYLEKACAIAKRFDAAPSFTLSGLKYHYGENHTTTYDDFGASIMEGIANTIRDNAEITDKLMAIYDEICKKES